MWGQSVPHIGISTGLCPALAEQFGGDECFSKSMPVDSRWEVLITSGCRLGQEYLEAWGALKNEALVLTEWLGEDLDGVLEQSVRGAGMGCVTGATRKLVVKQMEKMWGRVLRKTLNVHDDRRVTERCSSCSRRGSVGGVPMTQKPLQPAVLARGIF